jgi:hypothetical protein
MLGTLSGDLELISSQSFLFCTIMANSPMCSIDVSYNGEMHTIIVSANDVRAAPRISAPYGTNVRREQLVALLDLIAGMLLRPISYIQNLFNRHGQIQCVTIADTTNMDK